MRLDGRIRPSGPVKSITFEKEAFLEKLQNFRNYRPIMGTGEDELKIHALGAARAYPLFHILLQQNKNWKET